MGMPGRKYEATLTSKYRYSINGQEKESELNENITTALYWEYDSRIGRRWNLDPKPNIAISPYATFENNPLFNIDILGDTTVKTPDGGCKDLGDVTITGAFKGGEGTLVSTGNKIQTAPNSTRDFTIQAPGQEPSRFVAMFGENTGRFLGYYLDSDPTYSIDDYYRAWAEDVQSVLDNPDLMEFKSSPEDARNSFINMHLSLAMPTVLIKPLTIAVNAQKILSKIERLNIFKSKLLNAPGVNNADEALGLINKTLDNVEDVYSGVVKNAKTAVAGKSDGRMYGFLDEKFITRHADGTITALTRGHRVEIEASGNFSIFNRTDGSLFLKR